MSWVSIRTSTQSRWHQNQNLGSVILHTHTPRRLEDYGNSRPRTRLTEQSESVFKCETTCRWSWKSMSNIFESSLFNSFPRPSNFHLNTKPPQLSSDKFVPMRLLKLRNWYPRVQNIFIESLKPSSKTYRAKNSSRDLPIPTCPEPLQLQSIPSLYS